MQETLDSFLNINFTDTFWTDKQLNLIWTQWDVILKVHELQLQSGGESGSHLHHSIIETKYVQELKFLVCFLFF